MCACAVSETEEAHETLENVCKIVIACTNIRERITAFVMSSVYTQPRPKKIDKQD